MEDSTNKIKIEPVIWWGVDSKNGVKKYDSPNKKNRISYWIKQVDEGKRNTTMYKNTYEIYTYEIFDNKLNSAELVFNNWKIRRVYDPIGKNAYNYTKAEFVDPFNEIRTNQISSIEDALKTLNEICEYNNWQTYDLNILNKKLTEENERLKEENEEFHSKTDAFLGTRLYKRMLKKAQGIIHPKANSKTVQKTFIKEYGVNSNFIHQWFKK